MEDPAAPCLLPHQIEHVNQVNDIFSRFRFSLDTSKMGLGKTYIACKIAQARNLRLVVVCPPTLQSKWKDVSTEWGVDAITMTYHAVRGRDDGPTANGYLMRTDKEFVASEEFEAMVAEGILLVADEAQSLKNTSAQARAFAALCLPIKRAEATESRLLLLSATPFDKQEHVMNILQFALIRDHKTMYVYEKTAFGTGEVVLTGANELIRACLNVDPAVTKELLGTYPTHLSRNVSKLVYKLFVQVLQNKVCAYMVGDAESQCPPPEVRTTFYVIEGEALSVYRKGVSDLQKSVLAMQMQTPGRATAPPDWGGIGKALQCIEWAKRHVFVRMANAVLKEDPQAKVVIGLNYTNTVEWVRDNLTTDVLILNGSVPPKLRGDILKKYQAANTKHRVMIGNMAVMEVGIDLDDKEGSFPRTCFFSPHYRATGLHQAIGRVFRVNSASQATVHMVYGPLLYAEKSVLNALARKTGVLKETLPGQVAAGTVFPGDYNCEEEVTVGTFREISNVSVAAAEKQEIANPHLNVRVVPGVGPLEIPPVAPPAAAIAQPMSTTAVQSEAVIRLFANAVKRNWQKFGGEYTNEDSIRAIAVRYEEICRGKPSRWIQILDLIPDVNHKLEFAEIE